VVRTDQDVRCERPQRSSVVATTGSLGVATLGCDPLKDGDVPVIEASWKALRSRQGRNHDLSVCDHRCRSRPSIPECLMPDMLGRFMLSTSVHDTRSLLSVNLLITVEGLSENSDDVPKEKHLTALASAAYVHAAF
jgi:hypothetical protein